MAGLPTIDLSSSAAERMEQIRPYVQTCIDRHRTRELVDADTLTVTIARALPAGEMLVERLDRLVFLFHLGAYADAVPRVRDVDAETLNRLRAALRHVLVDGPVGWVHVTVALDDALRELAARDEAFHDLPEHDPFGTQRTALQRFARPGRELASLRRVAERVLRSDWEEAVHPSLARCLERLEARYLFRAGALVRPSEDVVGDLLRFVRRAVRNRAFDELRRRRPQALRPAGGAADEVARLLDPNWHEPFAAAEAAETVRRLVGDMDRLRHALFRALPRTSRHRRIVLRALEAMAAGEYPTALGANPDHEPHIALCWYAAHQLGEVPTAAIGPGMTEGDALYVAVRRAAAFLVLFLRGVAE